VRVSIDLLVMFKEIYLQLDLSSGMLKNEARVHDVDKGKREADVALCATNHIPKEKTHLARL